MKIGDRNGRLPPTPVSLAGKAHRQRSLVGYSPWGLKESDITEWLSLKNERVRKNAPNTWQIPQRLWDPKNEVFSKGVSAIPHQDASVQVTRYFSSLHWKAAWLFSFLLPFPLASSASFKSITHWRRQLLLLTHQQVTWFEVQCAITASGSDS